MTTQPPLKLVPDDPEGRERARKAAEKKAYRALIDGGGAMLDGMPVRDIDGLTELLIELEWLKEAASEDRKAVAVAIGAMLDDLVARSR
jgi:hypothetical protein